MNLLLAIDPGPSSSGYALVERIGPRARFVVGGAIASERLAFSRLFATLEQEASAPIAVLAVEVPSGPVFQPYRGPHLMATAGIARALCWTADARGMQVEEWSAGEVRKLVCGKANAKDAQVADAVRANVVAFPSKSNVHVRDASLLALAATWRLAGAAGKRVSVAAKA